MREILFRGKEIDAGEWVYGSLLYSGSEDQYYIVENDGEELSYPVSKETIGQYTGLCDKNGTKIFEGDIVGCFCNTQIFQVKWCDVRGGYFLDDVVMSGGSEPTPECLGNLVDTIEVIGNIFDNRELLEE